MGCQSSKSVETSVTDQENSRTFVKTVSSQKPCLYVDRLSPVARAVEMTARLLQLDVEIVKISLMKGEHKSDIYTKINPANTVPALVDGSLTLTQSQVIAAYLVNKYGNESKLYGSNNIEKAKIDELMAEATSLYEICKATSGGVHFNGEGPSDAQRMSAVEICMKVDQMLENKLYIMGNYPTLADIFLYNTMTSFTHLTNFHLPYKNLLKWHERLIETSKFQEMDKEQRDGGAKLQEMAPKLYWNPLSPPSRACHLVACHLNVPVNIIPIDFFKQEHKSPSYLKVNPNGSLPGFVVPANPQYNVDETFNLSDSNPIAFYLANTYGKRSAVYGVDLKNKARVDELMALEGNFRGNMSKIFVHKAFGAPAPTEDQIKKVDEDLDMFDEILEKTKFLTGDHVTIVDFFVQETFMQLIDLARHSSRPNIDKFMKEMKSLPYYNFAHKEYEKAKEQMADKLSA